MILKIVCAVVILILFTSRFSPLQTFQLEGFDIMTLNSKLINTSKQRIQSSDNSATISFVYCT